MKSLLKFFENFVDQMWSWKRLLTMIRGMKHRANRMYKRKQSINIIKYYFSLERIFER